MTKNGLGQGMGLAADRDLPLLHRLEQGALDLGRRAVDLVGQDQVGENGPAVGAEFAGLRLEDHRADDVARQEVGRELDPLELDPQRRAQRLDQQRLGQSGHALQEHVAAGEQGHEQPLDDGILADDGLADFIAEFLGPGGPEDMGESRILG